jgi:hypothetical protein
VSRPLPRAADAVIAAEKLRDYILSPTHPIGRFKGRFKGAFFAQLGYAQADWQRLAADLRSQHLPLAAQEIDAPPFGRKYRICGLSPVPLAGRRRSCQFGWCAPAKRRRTL